MCFSVLCGRLYGNEVNAVSLTTGNRPHPPYKYRNRRRRHSRGERGSGGVKSCIGEKGSVGVFVV